MRQAYVLAWAFTALMVAPVSAQTLDELLRAVHQGQLQVVTSILDRNPKLAQADNAQGHTALFDATYLNRPDIANLLVARGSDVNHPTKRHTLPLHAAALCGSLEITTLLVFNAAQLDVTNPEGQTPLHVASHKGHTDIVKLLLSKGANPKIRDLGGSTPLHLAARRGSPQVVEALLGAGADRGAKDHRGRTPLQVAEQGKHGDWQAVVRLLQPNKP